MKKFVALLLCVLLCISVVSAFAEEEPVTLTLILRGGTYGEVIKAALPAYEEMTGIHCEVLDLSFDDLHSKIALDAINAEGAYDICMVDGSWMAEFASYGVLQNLSDMGYEYDEDIIPATTTAGVMDDSIYLIPYFGNVTVMLYNKANLEAAGYAIEDVDSWDDVKAIAAAGKEAGGYGYMLRAQAGDNITSDFLPVLLANGGWVLDEDNNVTIDTPEFHAALEMYLELRTIGEIMDKDDIVAAVDSGAASISLGWPGWYVPAEDKAASYTVVPTKLHEGGEDVSTSIYGVWFIGMTANSTHKDEAMALLEWLTSADVQMESIALGGVPCRYSCLLNEEVLAEKPHLETVCNALEVGVYRPLIEQWTDFTNALGAELDNAMQGVKTVDEALADAQAACEEIMDA